MDGATTNPAWLADRFTLVFRNEHRVVRDTLMNLIDAFTERKLARIRALLDSMAVAAGPHFRYEEEALYPELVGIFGRAYIEKLCCDHDRIIDSARRLALIATHDQLSDGEVEEAVRLLRGMLPHVSDCDGLSIMVECLREDRIRRLFQARDHALREDLDLLTWAAEVRSRASLRV